MIEHSAGKIFDFLREKFYILVHAIEYLQGVRAKCGAFFFSTALGKRLNVIEEYEGLSLVDTRFAPINIDSPRPLKR